MSCGAEDAYCWAICRVDWDGGVILALGLHIQNSSASCNPKSGKIFPNLVISYAKLGTTELTYCGFYISGAKLLAIEYKYQTQEIRFGLLVPS